MLLGHSRAQQKTAAEQRDERRSDPISHPRRTVSVADTTYSSLSQASAAAPAPSWQAARKTPLSSTVSLSDLQRPRQHGYGSLSDQSEATTVSMSNDPSNSDTHEQSNRNISSWCPSFEALKTPIDVALSFQYFTTVRGVENLLIYLWILKDLCWTQNWYAGLYFSSIAVILFAMLAFLSMYWRCFDEAWHFIASFLWLFANTWWMSGELHDWEYPNQPHLYEERKVQCRHIMEAALVWIGLYFLVIKPFKIFDRLGIPNQNNNPSHKDHFYDIGIESRFPCFSTWRQYEQIHILFWLGKDYAWNTGDVPLWYICSISTLLIALDFIWETAQVEGLAIEVVHYLATFIWIVANMTWAIGELFYPNRDYAYNLFSDSPIALVTCRWYSAWLLVFSIAPIVCLYFFWVKGTCDGSIKSKVKKNKMLQANVDQSTAIESPIWVKA